MMKILSHILSWVFLPLFMPVYALLIGLYYPSNPVLYSAYTMSNLPAEVKSQLFWVFFIFSCAAPGISFIMLRNKNIINTIDMENAKERSVPLIIMVGYCAIMYALFLYKAPNGVLPKYFYALPLSGMLVASLFLWINQRIKISMHAGGGGVLCGFLVAFYSVHSPAPLLLIIGAFLVSGLTISARLYLEKHRPIEVYSGWLFAFFITFCCNWFYPG